MTIQEESESQRSEQISMKEGTDGQMSEQQEDETETLETGGRNPTEGSCFPGAFDYEGQAHVNSEILNTSQTDSKMSMPVDEGMKSDYKLAKTRKLLRTQ